MAPFSWWARAASPTGLDWQADPSNQVLLLPRFSGRPPARSRRAGRCGSALPDRRRPDWRAICVPVAPRWPASTRPLTYHPPAPSQRGRTWPLSWPSVAVRAFWPRRSPFPGRLAGWAPFVAPAAAGSLAPRPGPFVPLACGCRPGLAAVPFPGCLSPPLKFRWNPLAQPARGNRTAPNGKSGGQYAGSLSTCVPPRAEHSPKCEAWGWR